MNIAWIDIRYHFVRFVMATVGVGLLFSATIGMIGLYRGVVFEALMIIREMGGDIWVVQGDRAGPFAEESEISGTLARRLEGVAGIKWSKKFIQFNQQFEIGGRHVRMAVTGLDYPDDNGSWVPLVAGRYLYSGHYEAIADESLGFDLGSRIRIRRDDYTIVGLTARQVDMAGDGIMFVSIGDARAMKAESPSEAVLLRRASNIGDPSSHDETNKISAVIAKVDDGTDLEQVRQHISSWGDVAVYTRVAEEEILLYSRMWRLLLQILAFVVMTLLVTVIVVGLSVYTMTLEKAREIALLKLIGARDPFIIWMIVQQALFIGAVSFGIGLLLAHLVFPHFPRTVLIEWKDVGIQFLVALVLCAASSWFGIRKALAIRAQDVLS
jgi:putative ABC transport system permease protein